MYLLDITLGLQHIMWWINIFLYIKKNEKNTLEMVW